MTWRRAVAGAMGLAMGAFVHGQSAYRPPRFVPEQMRGDIEVLRRVIHQSHPDPYRYHTRTELDRIIDHALAACALPMDAGQFADSLMPVFHALGDAHARLDMPVPYRDHLDHDVPLLPIRVRIIDGALHLEEELKGFRTIPPGSRILSINGHGDADVVARMSWRISADGNNTTRPARVIERDFMRLYHQCMEQAASFDVRFIDPAGTERIATLVALTADEMRRSMPAMRTTGPWTLGVPDDPGTAWLTLATLDRAELEAAGVKPAKALEEIAGRWHAMEARTLVIDVRGAGGADLGVAEQVFRLIALAPFRVVQQMSVRGILPPDDYAHALPQDEFYSSVGAVFLPDLNGAHTLRPDDPRLEPVPAWPRAFTGDVYVVHDGLTRDAGAAFVMLARRSGRARTVGEECGSNAFSFCDGRELSITAPLTGMVFHIPLTRFVPEGSPAGPLDHGEPPDLPAQQEAWGLVRGTDTVKSALLALIRELQ